MNSKRVKTPTEIETRVLTECARRCCFCLKLNNDATSKPGQIAHINQDRTDSRYENLAYLCLAHHDQYDSRTSQSKGITEGELKHAKEYLLDYLQNVDRLRQQGVLINRVRWVAVGGSVTYSQQQDGTWHEKHANQHATVVFQEEHRDDHVIVLYDRSEKLWVRLHHGYKYWSQKLHNRNLWQSAEHGNWVD